MEESAAEGHPAQESAAQGSALQHPGVLQNPAAQRQPPRACVPNTERVTGRVGSGRCGGGGGGGGGGWGGHSARRFRRVACEAHPIA